jgi:tetratricopeptide (TPR) repeat protein
MNTLLVSLSLAATAAFAVPDEWRVLLEQGQQFRHAGRHQDAAEAFLGAARLLERSGPPDMRLASVLNSLAVEYDDLARYPDAAATYSRALGILERVRGKDNGDYAQTLANLGAVHSTMGSTARGERMMTEAIAIFDSVEPADERAAVCRNMLGQSMLHARRLTEAEPLFEQARRALGAGPLPDSGRLASVLNNLGMVRRFQGRHDEAIVFLQQSIARLEAEFGPDHPLLARTLNNAAAEYALAGRSREAEAAFRRSAAIAESTLGPSHPLLGHVLANYARLLRDTGRKPESKRLEAQAREILRDSGRRNGAGMTVDAAAFATP